MPSEYPGDCEPDVGEVNEDPSDPPPSFFDPTAPLPSEEEPIIMTPYLRRAREKTLLEIQGWINIVRQVQDDARYSGWTLADRLEMAVADLRKLI